MRPITVGQCLIAIGVVHDLFGFIVGAEPIADIVSVGLFASVTDDMPWRMAIFWFQAFGLMLVLLGAVWHWVERQGLVVPAWAAVGLGIVGLVGVFFMPVSGFWTLFPVAMLAAHRARGASASLQSA